MIRGICRRRERGKQRGKCCKTTRRCDRKERLNELLETAIDRTIDRSMRAFLAWACLASRPRQRRPEPPARQSSAGSAARTAHLPNGQTSVARQLEGEAEDHAHFRQWRPL